MNIATPRRTAAALAPAVLVLTSCSMLPGDPEFLDQGARSMAKAAFADMREVTSLRVLGSVDTGQERYRIDLAMSDTSCSGSVDTGDGGFLLRKNSDGAWFKADEDFVRSRSSTRAQADQAWREFGGSWFALEDRDLFAKLCDLDDFLDFFTLDRFKPDKADPGETEATVDPESVELIGDGDAVPVTGRDGKERTTMWVAVESPHVVVKVAPAVDRGLPDALYFEDFGIDVVVKAPAQKDIVKIPGSLAFLRARPH